VLPSATNYNVDAEKVGKQRIRTYFMVISHVENMLDGGIEWKGNNTDFFSWYYKTNH